MLKKLETALSFKTKAGIVTIGVKSFMAHTPTGAKKAILIVCGVASVVAGWFFANPTVLPPKYQALLLAAAPIAIVVLHSLGIKCPFDANGNPIEQPADQISSLKKKQ